MAPLIEVQHLKKYFPTARGQLHAVDDVSFTIERGTTMGVVGESGCGKSTLGRTLIHLHESTDGKILFEGKDITRVNSKELKQLREDSVQIIFQDPYSSLNPRMTVEQTIREPLVLSRRFSKTEIDKETERLMDLVGLDRRLRLSYPNDFYYCFQTIESTGDEVVVDVLFHQKTEADDVEKEEWDHQIRKKKQDTHTKLREGLFFVNVCGKGIGKYRKRDRK